MNNNCIKNVDIIDNIMRENVDECLLTDMGTNYKCRLESMACNDYGKEMNLKVCCMNVYGGLESKLEINEFIRSLVEFDVVLLSETWTDERSKLELKGYSNICKHRPKKSKAKRNSGGLVCYLRNKMEKGVKLEKWDFEDGVMYKVG